MTEHLIAIALSSFAGGFCIGASITAFIAVGYMNRMIAKLPEPSPMCDTCQGTGLITIPTKPAPLTCPTCQGYGGKPHA